MTGLQNKLNNLRNEYRKIFLETAVEISDMVEYLRPKDVSGEIFEKYPDTSSGYLWQENVLKLLNDKFKKEISSRNKKICSIRENFHCTGCGTCCRFAVSEFSPEELAAKTKNGDKTAGEFIKTFVPYNSIEEAKEIFSEYIDMLETEGCSGYYIYHCPKVTQDNRCPDYENRPQICRDFPDNPIAFLPPKCSFTGWKLKSASVSLKLRAEVEIIKFYINKIKGLQNR